MRRRKAALHRRHGVVDQEISEHRVAEGPADERCRVSQGRVPLSEPKVRKILDTTERMLDAFERVGWGALLIGAEGRVIRCCNGPRSMSESPSVWNS